MMVRYKKLVMDLEDLWQPSNANGGNEKDRDAGASLHSAIPNHR